MPSNNFEEHIPLSVPKNKKNEFIDNYTTLTKSTERLFIFSCDQKIEHLNSDFYGHNISKEANDPKHIFEIAQEGRIGGLATQLGLISRYAKKFSKINYIVKLNSKTNIIQTKVEDPISSQLWSIEDVINFKKETKLPICGVGYTIYLGSKYEHIMLAQAAQIITQAHKHGLVTILWIYPRGQSVNNINSIDMASGAVGVANALGSDFVKIQMPNDYKELEIVSQAAGNTKIISAGGQQIDKIEYLKNLIDQINVGGISGCAVGRNIFQRSLHEAVNLTLAISSIVYDHSDLTTAIKKGGF